MGWNRLKLVLAAVLLGANLLLLYLIGTQARALRYIPDESVQEVKRLLQRDGISLSEDAMSVKKQSLVIYSGEIGDTYYVGTAEALSQSAVSLSFNTPNGVVISMENGDRCVFEGGFGIRYEAAGFLSLLETAGFSELQPSAVQDGTLETLSPREQRALLSTVENFLSAVNPRAERQTAYDMTREVHFSGRDAETQVLFLACGQRIRDTEITTLSAVFAVLNGEVIGMKGDWCFSEVQTTYFAQLYDQVNILYKVKDHILADSTASHNVVTSLALAYAVYYRADSDLFYLIPTWQIDTDMGTTYILNALNGALYTE